MLLWANSRNTLTKSCKYCRARSSESTLGSSLGTFCLGFAQCKPLLLPATHISTATPRGWFGRGAPRGGHKRHRHFCASVPCARSALRRARGPVFASDHSQSFMPELSEGSHSARAKWLPGWHFSVAPVRGLAPQRRLLLFIPVPQSPLEEGGGIWSPVPVCSPEHPHSSSRVSV